MISQLNSPTFWQRHNKRISFFFSLAFPPQNTQHATPNLPSATFCPANFSISGASTISSQFLSVVLPKDLCAALFLVASWWLCSIYVFAFKSIPHQFRVAASQQQHLFLACLRLHCNLFAQLYGQQQRQRQR